MLLGFEDLETAVTEAAMFGQVFQKICPLK